MSEINGGQEDPMSKVVLVYFKVSQTKIIEESDNEERPYWRHESSSKIETKAFPSDKIEDAFNEQDGDGDDSGSWSKDIFLITKQDGTILYNPYGKHAKLCQTTEWMIKESKNISSRERSKAINEELSIYEEYVKSSILNGVF